ncbi:MAG: hypothetical protein CMG74_04630 [Candidatus Marinimicrobia bacterium]|nr:hypothetical protein [Candidatus Neomarinimicrobiota bacterium]|tara:strand:+ start:1450 stop:2160 length:711 start_codon:yes stop_codon:yes gene_type:complete
MNARRYTFKVLPTAIKGNEFFLSKSESEHCIQVLRLKKNDNIFLIDGKGNGYNVAIDNPNPICVSGKILEAYKNYGENSFCIHLGIPVIKRNRFEFILEKATEMGTQEITPLNFDRCNKKEVNLERCEKIIIAAAKQCCRSQLPIIHSPIDLNQFFVSPKKQVIAGKINVESTLTLLKLNPDIPINVIIGPEGDFSDREIDTMDKNKVLYFNLGNRRLRSETAALNSIAILNELYG